MNDNVTINNKNIANYIMFKLDKTTNSFSADELSQITELVIDYNNENESNFVFLNELKNCINVSLIIAASSVDGSIFFPCK